MSSLLPSAIGRATCSARWYDEGAMTVPRPLIALLVLLLPLTAPAQTRSIPRELRWGGDAEGGAPFVEADPRNPSTVRGFDVEVAALIAHDLGRTPRFIQVAWSSIDDHAFVRQFASRVVILADGVVVDQGDPAHVLDHSPHPSTHELLQSKSRDSVTN